MRVDDGLREVVIVEDAAHGGASQSMPFIVSCARLGQVGAATPNDHDGTMASEKRSYPATAEATPWSDPARARTVDEFGRACRRREEAELRAWFEAAGAARDAEAAGALAECATRHGMDIRTLRRWTFAVRRISRAEFETLCGWRDSMGRPLTSCSLLELARLPCKSRVEALGELFASGCSVVKMRKCIRPK